MLLAQDPSTNTTAIVSQPWLGLQAPNAATYTTAIGIMPSSLYATAFNGDIDLVGGFTLTPSARAEVALEAAGSINGFQPNSINLSSGALQWGSSTVNLSDADPARVPGLADPLDSTADFVNVNALFSESGSVTGAHAVLQTQQALHAAGLLHADDLNPVEIFGGTGNVSGLTLYSAKSAQVVAGKDITDVGLYVQNDDPGDITTVTAGGDITPYDPASPLRTQAQAPGNALLVGGTIVAGPSSGNPTAGDIQLAGPGTLEVLAGSNINLGQTVGSAPADGTSVGITSIGNSANPNLPFQGADIVMAAGITGLGNIASSLPGLSNSAVDFSSFIAQYVNPATAAANAARYLPELAQMLGVTVAASSTPQQIWATLPNKIRPRTHPKRRI